MEGGFFHTATKGVGGCIPFFLKGFVIAAMVTVWGVLLLFKHRIQRLTAIFLFLRLIIRGR